MAFPFRGGTSGAAHPAHSRGGNAMLKDGKPTTNGWLFIAFLVLVLTTTINPVINNKYFTILWYPLVALYGLWVLIRVVNEEEDTS